MYSIVMLAAMTATPATPEFHGLLGGWCHKHSYSCVGCTGYTSCAGCTGNSCTGYVYNSCSGCTGYSCTGYTSCNGCSGGVYYGYSPYTHGSGLFHGHKAYYRASCYGCGGGYACHGVPTYYHQSYSCTGCTGYTSGAWFGTYTLGEAVPPAAGGVYPAAPATPPAATTPPAGKKEPATPMMSLPGVRAQVVVKVPANAKLYADGQLTSLTGEERTFVTPELDSNRDYQYTLKVEQVVDGELKTESKDVLVRAGQQTVVDLSMGSEVSKLSSPVTVTLPENAKLFVDDNLAVTGSGRKTFRTPVLAEGASYTYVFRVEVDVAGKVETQSQKVNFKAGEPIRVDFADMTATRTALAR